MAERARLSVPAVPARPGPESAEVAQKANGSRALPCSHDGPGLPSPPSGTAPPGGRRAPSSFGTHPLHRSPAGDRFAASVSLEWHSHPEPGHTPRSRRRGGRASAARPGGRGCASAAGASQRPRFGGGRGGGASLALADAPRRPIGYRPPGRRTVGPGKDRRDACAAQLDAPLAAAIVAVAKRAEGKGRAPAEELKPDWLRRAAGAPCRKLIGPGAEEREKQLEPAVPLRRFVAPSPGPSPGWL